MSIDGYTQPGSTQNTKARGNDAVLMIELNGESAEGASTPGASFKVQFFSNPSGNEGKKFIGQRSITTGSDGNVTFTFTPAQAVAASQNVTATATSASGDTSEFSASREVVAR